MFCCEKIFTAHYHLNYNVRIAKLIRFELRAPSHESKTQWRPPLLTASLVAADVLNFHNGRQLIAQACCIDAEQSLDMRYADRRSTSAEQCAAGGSAASHGLSHFLWEPLLFAGGRRPRPRLSQSIPIQSHFPHVADLRTRRKSLLSGQCS